MHRLLGLPEQWSASYSAFAQAIHPDDQGFVQERIQSALRGEQAYDCEFRIVRPKGEVRWLTARAEVVRDDAGEPVRMVGVNFDITRRKRAEEDLARFNADLERQVREDAAKLVQLQKMESVGQLTGGIAHDFNNLLMAVLGSLEILRKRLPEDPKLRRLIDNAIQGAERGAALTQRMLAFARRQDLKPQPVAIPELVGGMKDLLKRSLGPQIKIETRFALDAPKALVDPNQLELAILNLALNARDAMPEGGRLSIEVDEETISPGGSLAPGAYVRLRIVDSGTGMDEETLRRATEPFFTTKGVGKGTGLGLSMVHGLAEQSGGHFRLKSELGRGTCAEILLPVALEAVSPLGESVEALEAQEPRSSRPLSVLAVDDDAIVLTGTADMLEDLGHRAIKAPSGPAALDLLRSGERVDVVLTDQAMPGMTGVQLAREIRAEWPGLPVVLATGYAELPEGAGGLFARRLGKPFRQEQLAAALGRAVEAASGKVVPLRSRGG